MVQQRLLEIAIREFGLKGLEGASTREIAAAAGTAMSSITYHYRSKEGLYLAAADHIAATMGEQMAIAMSLDHLPETPEEARASIQIVLGALADKMASEDSISWTLFIVREQMNPTEAFERLYGGLMGRMMNRLVELVGIATGWQDGQTAEVATVTLFGQVVVLRSSRASFLKLLRRDTIDEDIADALKRRIAANTDAILDRLIAERQELS